MTQSKNGAVTTPRLYIYIYIYTERERERERERITMDIGVLLEIQMFYTTSNIWGLFEVFFFEIFYITIFIIIILIILHWKHGVRWLFLAIWPYNPLLPANPLDHIQCPVFLMYVSLCWWATINSPLCSSPFENVTHVFVLTFTVAARMFSSSYLDGM